MQLSIYYYSDDSQFGGNKWTRTTDKNCLSEFGNFFPNTFVFGGNKWTRTTDLTLIRRVL